MSDETLRDETLGDGDRDADGGGRRPRSRRAGPPGVRLSAVLPGARFIACDDIVASGCCDNPERCGPGDVFVARLTARGDGHDHVARAIARGAAGVVAERMLPTFGRPLCIVPEGTGPLARIAHALAGDPARRLRVIAVTGTSGKTTTAWLAASVLAEAGLRVGVLSDLGCLDADGAEPVPANLARPKVLASWLRRLVDGGCTHAVVEVSSAMLAADCLAGIACDTVVVTNLASAHLDIHGTPAAYRRVKARILDSLAADGCLVIDADDPRARRLARRHARSRPADAATAVVTTALRARADIAATPVERGLAGQTFLVRTGGHAVPVAVATPVASFARDALLATAVGRREGVPLERIARGIEAAGTVPGRVERIDRGQDHAVFVDHPTSRHALVATLAGLRRLTPGRLVVLAESRVAARLAADGASAAGAAAAAGAFERCVLDRADECAVVPDTLMHDSASAADVLAYARIDRLLAGLGGTDCLLVLGDARVRRHTPTDPGGEPMPLAAVVDGWLQLAHEPQPWGPARRVA